MRAILFSLLAILLAPAAISAANDDLLSSKERYFTPRLGDKLPPDLVFRDEAGKQVRLIDFGKDPAQPHGYRPVILVLAYFRCPMLCTLTLNDLVKGLHGVALDAGKDFDVVVVSFDARETPELARAKKKAYVEEYGRPGAENGWHFLTGDQENIDRLMEAVGFRAVWDEQGQQFAHARGLLFLGRDLESGQLMVTRYFLGGAFPPRDLRLAITETSEGQVGNVMDRVLLMCFNYNPVTGKYSVAILNAVKIGGLLTVALLVGFWVLMWRRARRRAVAPLVAASGLACGLTQPTTGPVVATERPASEGKVQP
jgi:protein SCO1/2